MDYLSNLLAQVVSEHSWASSAPVYFSVEVVVLLSGYFISPWRKFL